MGNQSFLEDYTLLDELGQGGYATVYKVRHNQLGYIRAIRVLNATIAHGETDRTYQKFLEECKVLLRLGNGNHNHIVHIYQPLLKAQKAIVEMDYVNGQDAFHHLEENSFFVSTDEVLKLLNDIGSALAYCHEDIYKFCMDKDDDNLEDDPEDGSKVLLDEATRSRLITKYRVIHNDIHSGNIMRREDGNYVLLDFGLALDGDKCYRSSKRRGGVPEFKSPEKWENDSILTAQCDIYSFGVVLYEFLAGRVPFPFDKKNSNPVEAEYLLSKAHRDNKPEPIFELRKKAFERSHPGETYTKDYPDWLEELIMKCLEKNPEDRFMNGKELHEFAKKNSVVKNKVVVETPSPAPAPAPARTDTTSANNNEINWVKDKKTGHGVYVWSSGTRYEGDFVDGVQSGKGILTWGEKTKWAGHRYEGDFIDGKRTGKGIYTWANGDRYEGDFIDGKRIGKGILTWGSKTQWAGDRYEGDFIDDGKRTGKGIYTWASGRRYEGDWVNGNMTGRGIHAWPNGDRYEGDYKDGRRNGKGIYRWQNGDIYIGDFVNDARTGKGVFIFASGNVYHGDFVNGARTGKGIFTWPGGHRYEGDFLNNKRTGKGTYMWPSGNRYEGDWKDGNQHGKGIFRWNSGDRYEGEYANDKKHGRGTYYYKDGSSKTGQWVEDKYVSR